MRDAIQPEEYRRRSVRLREYDYTQSGAYFITICTAQRVCLLGEIIDGMVCPNQCGQIVEQEWLKSAQIRDGIELDAFVVMPNHFHGILVLNAPSSGSHAGPGLPAARAFSAPLAGSVSSVVGAFKAVVSRRIGVVRNRPGVSIWQKNYHDHVIRNSMDLDRIRAYIEHNPARWAEDVENPGRRTVALPECPGGKAARCIGRG